MYFYKKALLLGSTLMLSTLAMAQPEPGTFSIIPKVGVSTTTLTKEPGIEISFINVAELSIDEKGGYVVPSYHAFYGNVATSKTKYKVSYTAGVDFQWQCTERWALVSGVNYGLQGCQYENLNLERSSEVDYLNYWDAKDINIDLHYLSVPVMAKFYLGHGFALNAGAQINWLMKGNLKTHLSYSFRDAGEHYFRYNGDFNAINVEADKLYESDKTTNMTDDMKRIEANIPVGISYEFGQYVADFRTNIGLTNVYKESSNKGRNLGFTLSVGYRFDL